MFGTNKEEKSYNKEKSYFLYIDNDKFFIGTKYIDIEDAIQEAKRICYSSKKTVTILSSNSIVRYIDDPVEYIKL